MRSIRTLVLAVFIAPVIYAHQQPTTLVVLDIASDRVTMNLHVPLNELELAFGHRVAASGISPSTTT